jgi:hypothetical protein
MKLSLTQRSFWIGVLAVGLAGPLRGQGVPDYHPDPEKTDVLILRNGDSMTGEFKGLTRGLVEFKTDAMSTIYVKWPRVITAATDKEFEIHLDDGRIFVGTMDPTDSAQVIIRDLIDTLSVPTQSVVEMVRLKRTWFQRLDGNFSLGFDFTQQNNKVDLYLNGEVRYDIPRNRFRLTYDGTFSRQDSVSNITRRDFRFDYSNLLSKNWFWGITAANSENSQLGLENATQVGIGPGRFLVQSNRVELMAALVPYIRRETYVNDAPRTTAPLAVVADFELFNWAGMSTDLSSRLSVAPVLNDSGRWQVSFNAKVKRELLNQLYLTVGVVEIYDSKPPSNTNKNDFSLSSSLGWSF